MKLILKRGLNYITVGVLILILISFNVVKVIELGDGIPFNIAVSDLLIPVAGLLILLRLVVERSFKGVKFLPLMLLLMAWLVLTNWLGYKNEDMVANEWMTVFGEWVKTAICLAYFYVGYQVLHYMSKQWMLRFYAFGYMIFIVYGYVTLYALNRGIDLPLLEDNVSRYFLGTYHDPNHGATYMTLSFFLLLYGVHFEHRFVVKGIYILLALSSFAALFLTDSRGGLLGFAVALFVYILLAYYNRLSHMITLMWSMLMALFGALVFDARVNDGKFIGNLFKSFMQFDKGLDVREGLMKAALAMGKDYPIFGLGRGNYILNAKTYADQLGLTIEYNIPHNTYIGLFAEVGIIGVLLYMLPVILIALTLVRKRKVILSSWSKHQNFIASLAAMAAGLAIQAYVLNVENRRTLWLLAGVILMWVESLSDVEEIADKSSKVTIVKKGEIEDQFGSGVKLKSNCSWLWINSWHSWLNVVLGMLTLIFFFYTINEVHWPKSYETVYGNYIMELPVGEEYIDQPMELEFYLYTGQSGFKEQDTVEVRIVEEHVKGYKSMRYTFVYPRSNGTFKVPFTKEWKGSKLYLEVIKESSILESYRLWPKRLLTGEEVLYLNRDYYMVSKEDKVEHLYSQWEKLNQTLYETQTFKPKLADYQGSNFGALFSIQSVKYEFNDDRNQLIVTYKALQDINEDYNIYLYGNPDNLANLDVSKYLSNAEYYSPVETILTSEWRQNESYQVIYDFPRDYGWYRLVGGIQHKVDDKWVRLEDNETARTYVIYGWFEAGETSQ